MNGLGQVLGFALAAGLVVAMMVEAIHGIDSMHCLNLSRDYERCAESGFDTEHCEKVRQNFHKEWEGYECK
jgi:hypothetical protein